jgi:hypothetical protein
MATNFDTKHWAATNGQRVVLREWHGVPASGNGVGTVRGIEHDLMLSSMNKKNIQMYRILVDFGDEKLASVLPCLLKRLPRS